MIPQVVSDSGQASAERVVETARGERAKVDLPDGSTVLLAPDSRVQYASGFGKSHRTIDLQGQALFTVTHSEGVAFVVRAKDVETLVLGTTFGVRRYTSDSLAEVIVAAGRVAVSSAEDV